MTQRAVFTLAGALLFCAPEHDAAAHHSFAAEFDADQPVELHGTAMNIAHGVDANAVRNTRGGNRKSAAGQAGKKALYIALFFRCFQRTGP